MTRTKRQKRLRAEARHAPRAHCPTPDKKAYTSQHQAEDVISGLLRTPHPGPIPHRAYLCPCGAWHLTHQPLRNHQTTPQTSW